MNQKLFDLAGKTALLTGSSKGLGYVIARGLAREGAKVILNGRNQDILQVAAKSIQSEGFEVKDCVFDISDENEIRTQLSQLDEKWRRIDILVNNAGVQMRNPLETFDLKDWQNVLNINLTGAFLAAKAVVQGMIERKSGKIINICSIMSEIARPSIAPYTAAKGGLKMLTKSMATEWGCHNIQVNAIGPGYFATEMTKALKEDAKFDTWVRSRTPAGRWGDPEELVGPTVFLASQASNYVNGHVLYVDGGMLACI